MEHVQDLLFSRRQSKKKKSLPVEILTFYSLIKVKIERIDLPL